MGSRENKRVIATPNLSIRLQIVAKSNTEISYALEPWLTPTKSKFNMITKVLHKVVLLVRKSVPGFNCQTLDISLRRVLINSFINTSNKMSSLMRLSCSLQPDKSWYKPYKCFSDDRRLIKHGNIMLETIVNGFEIITYKSRSRK